MKYIEVLVCAALISFTAGLFYSTEYTPSRQPDNLSRQELHELEHPVESHDMRTVYPTKAAETIDQILDGEQPELTPCSKTNTMPCELSPKDPVKEELEDHPQKEGLFRKGEKVTCVYEGVYSWTDGNEFVKGVAMQCDVLQVTEELPEFGPHYQHIKVNCLKGLEKMWSDQPGVGMVKGHKLNLIERWYSSDECYHFQQG